MTKILMHGCNGRMGQMISGIVRETPDTEIVAGVDLFDGGQNDYPVFSSLNDVQVDYDVIIDFSSAAAVDALLSYVEKTKKPCVLCTTGLSKEQLTRVQTIAQEAAILKSANMSLGINLLFKVLKEISGTLSEAGFDIEIVEKHHNQKLDAPSGTALALGDAVNAGLTTPCEYVFDRSNRRAKRPKNEIGYSAVRGGTIVGDHDVIFAGQDEVVTLSHRAYSRAVFGKGAVAAARFLAGKQPGLYDMADVIG